MKSFVSATAALSLATSALAATYTVVDTYTSDNFLDMFDFEAIPDPTSGRVNYVDKASAQSLGLAKTSGSSFVFAADDTTVLSATGAGRNSVRVQSVNAYGSGHVSVFNIKHMPQGCGTWPAVWELGPDWPADGEIDIVEGVNDVVPNQSTLHTSPGCTMPSGITQTGSQVTTDCNTAVAGNTGCAVHTTDANSYGPAFNTNGGGIYAMERTDDFVKVWFWSATDTTVPSDASSGAASVDTDNWGTPDAYFPNTDCDIASHFTAANIIINIDFCGDWAGQDALYTAAGCPSTCVDYVNNNPTAFTNAYFEFESIHVYEA